MLGVPIKVEKFTGLVTATSRILDKIAGFCMVSIMLLVVSNIVLRVLFNHPILGTYEYVVFLTVAAIGLSLAHCAVQNGHIAVDILMDRLPLKIQGVIDLVMNTAALLFWGLCAWQIGIYANKMAISGLVSPTSQIPMHPFIYLVAFSILALSLVLLSKTMESLQKVFLPSPGSLLQGMLTESIQKAAVNK